MMNYLMPLISSPWLYVLLAVAVAIDGFIPVIPSEVMVIGLGALSATGSPNIVALAAAVVAGGIAGDQVTYVLGRKAGRHLTNPKLAAARAKAETALLRYGGSAILIGRFLPYGRTASALTAGSVSMPRGKYRLFTALAGVAWAAYAIGLGRLGGATFAHQPLIGAAFGAALGFALAGIHSFVEKRRTAAEMRALTLAEPEPERDRELVGAGR